MDKNKCNYIKNNIEYTLLKDIIKDSELYYDPKNNGNYDTDIEDDKEFLEMYKYFLDEKLNGKDISYGLLGIHWYAYLQKPLR